MCRKILPVTLWSFPMIYLKLCCDGLLVESIYCYKSFALCLVSVHAYIQHTVGRLR